MKKFTYDEVFNASLEYFGGDDLAAKVFVDKYALVNNSGEYLELTPSDMHHRLAKEFARIEKKYPNPLSEEEIFSLLDHYKYIVPQGSPMFGIGNDHFVQSLGNCFVVESPYDSYGGILKTDQEMAQLMKRRAGVGCDLSNIRPRGMPTNNAAKTTDGIGVFMERFSNTCREVAQFGRRGALLLSNSINHPEIETFITIKQDPKKVTGANVSVRITDEFMKAVKKDTDFTLKWPVDSDKPTITKVVKAKEIWDKIIECAHTRAEPGVLFWDTIINNSPADIYAEKYPNMKTHSTNPCFSGDAMIAVADGRNSISIKQLAEEGKDVPVYSVDPKTGKVSIKVGRNPRITGHNKKMVRIILDNGAHVDTTPDHNFMLLDGSKVKAKNLKNGDSLPRFTKTLEPVKTGGKDYYRVYCDVNDAHKDKVFEHRLIAKFNDPIKWNNVYDDAKKNGFINTGGLVIHHKDYDSLNNDPNNLEIMTFKGHSKLHSSIDTVGEKNGRYCGSTNDEIKEKAMELTKLLGRRFSNSEWAEFAIKNKLPVAFSKFRIDGLMGVTELSIECAKKLNLKYIDTDPRTTRIYKEMQKQGYTADIINGEVMVIKNCEVCKKDFNTTHYQREQSVCSLACSLDKLNLDQEFQDKRHLGIHLFNSNRTSGIRIKQAGVYSNLKFKLRRKPLMKEWEMACKESKLPYRIGKSLKFGYKNFKEVAEAGNLYNHKVVSVIELPDSHTVYNITVDDNHTVGIITETLEKKGNKSYSGIYTYQCGELPLGLDSCRLLVVNLLSFVKDPFTKKAEFDYEKFADISQKAQRLMDDLVDLEIEKIEKIIAKIKSDPEPEAVKLIELNLWKQFLESCIQGRRTGTGITALGDCLAALGIKYGSKKSIDMTGEIYRQLMINAYKSSFIMAGERGAFPIFEEKMEKDHPFISRVLEQDPELKKLYKKNGRRNISLLTTAPTGSVSTQTQTSSGIEPVFMLSYTRRKKVNSSDKDIKVDFIDDIGDKWQEFIVYHHGVKQWMGVTGETDITKSPYHGATANEIDWEASVDLQAAGQLNLDHSVSKTCNLPSDATKETVSKVYMRAWESGCKGFTVYRDGCRSGVLVAIDNDKKLEIDKNGRPTNINYIMAPKRPDELSCDIKKAKVQGEEWTLFVGLLNHKPYEVFGGLSSYIDIPNKFKFGKIIKNGKVNGNSTYNLSIGDGEDTMVIKNISSVFENKTFEAFSRSISLNLRHGVPINYIVEQLHKDKNSDMTSFSKVIGRVLKSYITDGTISTGEKVCPQCQAENSLTYQEGCLSCKNCTFSKCG